MYAALSDISYIAESVGSSEKESSSVVKNVGLKYCIIIM